MENKLLGGLGHLFIWVSQNIVATAKKLWLPPKSCGDLKKVVETSKKLWRPQIKLWRPPINWDLLLNIAVSSTNNKCFFFFQRALICAKPCMGEMEFGSRTRQFESNVPVPDDVGKCTTGERRSGKSWRGDKKCLRKKGL